MRDKKPQLVALVPERLREARLARGYSIAQLAEIVGVSRQAISQFELGRSKPGGDVLAKMVDALHFPNAFFTSSPSTSHGPVGVIFFRSLQSATKMSREMVSVRLQWLERIFGYLEDYVAFPKVDVPDLGLEDTFDPEEIEEIARKVREHWGLGMGPIPNVVFLLEKHGVIVARGSSGDSKTDGCSQWRGDRPFVFLGSDKNSAVRSRFDAAHELGHLVLHSGIENLQFDQKLLKRLEQDANRFASAFLLPRESFTQEIMSFSLKHFEALKKRWKVSMAAMIHRCSDLDLLSENQRLYLWRQMSASGYRRREPLDDVFVPESPTVLKQAVEVLVQNGIMSSYGIVDDLRLPQGELESLCGLPVGFFSVPAKVILLKIKQ